MRREIENIRRTQHVMLTVTVGTYSRNIDNVEKYRNYGLLVFRQSMYVTFSHSCSYPRSDIKNLKG